MNLPTRLARPDRSSTEALSAYSSKNDRLWAFVDPLCKAQPKKGPMFPGEQVGVGRRVIVLLRVTTSVCQLKGTIGNPKLEV